MEPLCVCRERVSFKNSSPQLRSILRRPAGFVAQYFDCAKLQEDPYDVLDGHPAENFSILES